MWPLAAFSPCACPPGFPRTTAGSSLGEPREGGVQVRGWFVTLHKARRPCPSVGGVSRLHCGKADRSKEANPFFFYMESREYELIGSRAREP